MSCKNCTCNKVTLESAKSINKIRIVPFDPDQLMSGSNTLVYFDGIPLKQAKSIEIKIDSSGLGTVKLEMYARIEMAEMIVKDAEIGVSDEKGS
jgi:hypothetical protein